MTFVRRLNSIFPTFGSPILNDTLFLEANVALSGTGQQSTAIPASSGAFAPAISTGKIRYKIYGGGGTSPTLTDVVITATDGTNTVTLGSGVLHPSSAIAIGTGTTGMIDTEIDFILDISATSFTIKTTLGGTSPTASMDVEVCATI